MLVTIMPHRASGVSLPVTISGLGLAPEVPDGTHRGIGWSERATSATFGEVLTSWSSEERAANLGHRGGHRVSASLPGLGGRQVVEELLGGNRLADAVWQNIWTPTVNGRPASRQRGQAGQRPFHGSRDV